MEWPTTVPLVSPYSERGNGLEHTRLAPRATDTRIGHQAEWVNYNYLAYLER